MPVYVFSKIDKEIGSIVHVHDCKKAGNLLRHPKEGAVQESLAGELLTWSGDLDKMPSDYVNLRPLQLCPHCYTR